MAITTIILTSSELYSSPNAQQNVLKGAQNAADSAADGDTVMSMATQS